MTVIQRSDGVEEGHEPGSRDRLLDELLDRNAIHDLIYAYANAADRRDHEKMRLLYHEDAIDDHGPFSQGAAVNFLDKLPEIQANMEILQHYITNVHLKLRGDYAEGEIYVFAFHRVKEEERSVDMLVGSRYLDKYEKRDGEWKYVHHVIVTDWFYPIEPSAVRLDHPFMAGSHVGKPGTDDPSYAFFELFRRGER